MTQVTEQVFLFSKEKEESWAEASQRCFHPACPSSSVSPLLSFIFWLVGDGGAGLPRSFTLNQHSCSCRPPRDLDSKAYVTIGDQVKSVKVLHFFYFFFFIFCRAGLMHESFIFQNFEVKADDLERIEELGRGAYGVVEKMRHVPSGVIMAVKVGWECD